MPFEPMPSDEYRTALARLGFTQAEAARFLHLSLRTSGNYATGATNVPFVVAALFRLMIKHKLTADDINALPANKKALPVSREGQV
jgi:hypothetical protein